MPYVDETDALAALTNGTAIPADLRQIVVSFPALRPAVAGYPGTDEAMLGWLRDLHDPLVDAQLATRERPASAPVPPSGPPEPTAPIPPAQPPQQPQVQQPVARHPQTTPVAPIPPTGPPQQAGAPARPGPLPPPKGSGNGPKIAIIAVAAIALLGGGVFVASAAGLLPGLGSRPEPQLTAVPPPSDAPTLFPATSLSPEAPTPINPPSITQEPVGFACWDGSGVDALADCPGPASRDQAWAYLQYVYPSLSRHDSCSQKDSTGKSDYKGVTVMWECELGDSLLRYRYWVDPADAQRHYDRKFKTTTAETYDVAISGQVVAGWVKTSQEPIAKQTDGSKRYVATMWLPELQLSMSAEGNDTAAMWAAFDLVRIRPLPQLNGYQLDAQPAEVPLTVTQR